MVGTTKNKLNKIREEMKCNNEEIPLQVKNRVGSGFKQIKEAITKLNSNSNDMEW